MGGNRIHILIVSLMMLVLAIWGVSFVLTLQDLRHQMAIMTVIALLLILCTVKRDIPIDGKLLIILTFGYFIGGKGFAYLSPNPPIYIGEIFFIFATLGFLIRSNFNLVKVCKKSIINSLILIACIFGVFRVAIDVKQFGMMAVRDSAMIYYSFLALTTCTLYQNSKFSRLFFKLLPYGILLGLGSYILSMIGVAGRLHEAVPVIKKIYAPHVDVAIPITICVAMMGFHFIRQRRALGICLLAIPLVIMATDKTAFLFCFVCTAFLFATVGKMRIIIGIGAVMSIIGILGLSFFSVFNSEAAELLTNSDVMGTVDAIVEGDKKTTTGWRLEWWRIVFRDTYNESPIWGKGLGSDITSAFMREYMGVEIPAAHQFSLTRYPHNIVFTIFGRLGFVGLTFFALYVIVFVNFCWKYCKRFIAKPDRSLEDVILVSFAFAGFCNGFIQSTYENPYAGIPHWICVGCMIGKWAVKTKKKSNLELNKMLT